MKTINGNLALDTTPRPAFDDVVFADGCVYSTDCNRTGLNNNVLVEGASGSGKTLSYVEANLLRTYNRNLMVVVKKPAMIRKYAPLLRKRGYRVETLNLSEPSKSTVSYDPLAYLRDYRDVMFLARSIIKANPDKINNTKADPYWDDTATSLLTALILYVLKTKETATFADVIDLFESMKMDYSGTMITTSLDDNFKRLERKFPNNSACQAWKTFHELPPRTASCVYGTLASTLGCLLDPHVLEMMRLPNKLDFQEFACRKSVLFIVTSAVNPAMDYIIGNFYTTALKELFEFAQAQENGKLPIPTHLMTDDACSGACIANLPELISIIREAELSISLICQSHSQLASVYGESKAVTISNCCDTHLYTGSMDLSTAREVSVRLNIPVSEVLTIPLGTFALFRRGSKPIIASRYPILEDPDYQKLTMEDTSTVAKRIVRTPLSKRERSADIAFGNTVEKAATAIPPEFDFTDFGGFFDGT